MDGFVGLAEADQIGRDGAHLSELLKRNPIALQIVAVQAVILGAFSYNAFSYVTKGQWTAALQHGVGVVGVWSRTSATVASPRTSSCDARSTIHTGRFWPPR